jgi:hypothetical protein
MDTPAYPNFLPSLFRIEGESAREDGALERDNPYPPTFEEHQLWAAGWQCADDTRWISC